MKKQLIKGFAILAFGFILLFVFRLGYGYSRSASGDGVTYQQLRDYFSDTTSFKKNYATAKYKPSVKEINLQASTMEQKYEKVAEASVQTGDYDNDEKKLRDMIVKYKGLVQYEKKSGLEGSRTLLLSIGVPPENFDEVAREIKKVGVLKSIEINKSDKTNEFKELLAQKKTLEKTRKSLISLKSRGGKIEELVKLENRILEIEERLQKLGVNLGEFDEENQFCTVKVSLYETIIAGISFIHRVKVALEWTIKYYALLVFTFTLGLVLLLIALMVLEKMKWVQNFIISLVEKSREEK